MVVEHFRSRSKGYPLSCSSWVVDTYDGGCGSCVTGHPSISVTSKRGVRCVLCVMRDER